MAVKLTARTRHVYVAKSLLFFLLCFNWTYLHDCTHGPTLSVPFVGALVMKECSSKPSICFHNRHQRQQQSYSRRSFFFQSSSLIATTSFFSGKTCPVANAVDEATTLRNTPNNINTSRTPPFRSKGYTEIEYTNSITASRDTNLSPKEAYDVIRQRIPPATARTNVDISTIADNSTVVLEANALDLGAGAGVSTQVLYDEKGYKRIDAVDWSDDAWESNVQQPTPDSVRFFALDDDAFFNKVLSKRRQQQAVSGSSEKDCYDVIVYNFAVNVDKATRVAKKYLCHDGVGSGSSSLLLAPVNDVRDYWYKQSYLLLDDAGKIVWKSAPEVGAWSVQFQPDVTSDTCVGIWCKSFNGYK